MAGYGDQPPLLNGLENRRLPYMVGIPSKVRFLIGEEVERYQGDEPTLPYQGIGRPRKTKGFKDRVASREAGSILYGLDPDSWRVVAWRRGTRGVLRKLCARVRVVSSGLSRDSYALVEMAGRRTFRR